ncbi:MAG: hypothetical protein HZB38_15425 [Planctomycetes bacterium]|nr:hypothetical protein [Planctomycetota bacterium]
MRSTDRGTGLRGLVCVCIVGVLAGTASTASAQQSTPRVTARTGVTSRQPTSAPAFDRTKWLAEVDAALASGQFGTALQRLRSAPPTAAAAPDAALRAARAHLGLGQAFGDARVRTVEDGAVGRFDGEWLLVEKRPEAGKFLCAPRDSALYQIRRALDGGQDSPATHALHARIWLKANRPTVAASILKAREAALLESPTDETLGIFADTAIARDAIDEFLNYSQRRAELSPQRRISILHDAYLAASQHFNDKGDEPLYRAFLKRAVELKPDDADAVLRLADALWAADEKKEAVRWYRKTFELNPSSPDRERILERIAD